MSRCGCQNKAKFTKGKPGHLEKHTDQHPPTPALTFRLTVLVSTVSSLVGGSKATLFRSAPLLGVPLLSKRLTNVVNCQLCSSVERETLSDHIHNAPSHHQPWEDPRYTVIRTDPVRRTTHGGGHTSGGRTGCTKLGITKSCDHGGAGSWYT